MAKAVGGGFVTIVDVHELTSCLQICGLQISPKIQKDPLQYQTELYLLLPHNTEFPFIAPDSFAKTLCQKGIHEDYADFHL
jgi:hypothetical protein